MMGPRRVEQGALFYNFSIDAKKSDRDKVGPSAI